jgi:hypothetical protein
LSTQNIKRYQKVLAHGKKMKPAMENIESNTGYKVTVIRHMKKGAI